MVPINELVRGFNLFQEEYEKKVIDVLRSGWYVLGKEVESFEKEFANKLGNNVYAAVGGIVLMILLLKFIAKLNGREFTWQSIRAPKEGTENVKPINVWVILGWIFCLVFACLDLIGG